MQKYELLDHTADAKVKAWGNTLNQAFENVALGTFAIIIDPEEVQPRIKKEFTIKAKRMEALLYDFLEELLIFLDTDGWLLNKCEVNVDENNLSLSCVAYGDYYKKYDVNGNIKSVTYSDMEIKKVKELKRENNENNNNDKNIDDNKNQEFFEITVVHDL